MSDDPSVAMDEADPILQPRLVIDIDPPIDVMGQRLSELVLTEPTLGQVRDASLKLDDPMVSSPGAQREFELTLLQLNSRKSRVLVDELPARVIRRGVEFLTAHLQADDPLSSQPLDGETSWTINLDAPLKTNSGGEVHEITLHEPTGGQLRKAEELISKTLLPGTIRRYQARLIEGVSGLTPQVVSQLPISVSRQAMRFLESFEESARPTPRR